MCEWWYNHTYGNTTAVPAFEADADIAGIGVCIILILSLSFQAIKGVTA